MTHTLDWKRWRSGLYYAHRPHVETFRRVRIERVADGWQISSGRFTNTGWQTDHLHGVAASLSLAKHHANWIYA
jgi:hypothetical protein